MDLLDEGASTFDVWRDGACHRFRTRGQVESFLTLGDLVELTYADGRRESAEAVEWGDPAWPRSWKRITLRRRGDA